MHAIIILAQTERTITTICIRAIACALQEMRDQLADTRAMMATMMEQVALCKGAVWF